MKLKYPNIDLDSENREWLKIDTEGPIKIKSKSVVKKPIKKWHWFMEGIRAIFE